MDVFKLLSRSTSLKSNTAGSKGRQTQQLPSNGAAKNPQLFTNKGDGGQSLGIATDTMLSKKRKRGEDMPRSSHTLRSELDFFGNGDGFDGILNRDGDIIQETHAVTVAKTAEGRNSVDQEEAIHDLSEEECKRILKAHKLKITLLEGCTDPLRLHQVEKSKKVTKRRANVGSDSSAQRRKANSPLFPQPLTHFSQLRSRYSISRRLADRISDQGYTIPTEVQLGALPLLIGPVPGFESVDTKAKPKGSKDKLSPSPAVDLLTVAPTGSGKTLAFLIPIIQGLIEARRTGPERSADHHRSVKAIILAPTRELADQIVNEGKKLAMGTGIKVTGMRKGMRIMKSEDSSNAALSEEENSESDQTHEDDGDTEETSHKVGPLVKTDVLVSTPLMLLHAISMPGSTDTISLHSVRYLVLDEADVLLDPLFRLQTLGIWNACVNPELRTSLWSATMGSNVEELARQTISVRQKSLGIEGKSLLVRLVVGLKDSAIPNISHRLIYAATERGKLLALRQLLHPTSTSVDSGPSLRPPFLVFTQTIPRAIALHSELLYDIPLEAGGSSRIAVLHSDLSDTARSTVMARFRKGEIWILITTDLLSRGVDFRGVNGVVNYDVPNSGAAYVHRVGRTGRAGRDGGVAVTFYTKEDIPYVKNVANIIATSEKQGGALRDDSKGVQRWLLDALPKPSKKAKSELKRRGVEARRTATQAAAGGQVKGGKDSRKSARISTKSGYDRRLENNRKGAIRGRLVRDQEGSVSESASEWSGFED